MFSGNDILPDITTAAVWGALIKVDKAKQLYNGSFSQVVKLNRVKNFNFFY